MWVKHKKLIYGLADPLTKLVYYVGKTTLGIRRPYRHFSPSALRDSSLKTIWVQAVLATGRDPVVVVLEEVSARVDLSARELFWIAAKRKLNPALTNVLDRGKTLRGRPLSEEHRRRLRERGIDRFKDPTQREHMRQIFKGRTFSKETRQRMSVAQTKRMLDAVQRRKLAEARTNVVPHAWTAEERIAFARKKGARPFVDQFGNRYESVRGAGETLGVDSSSISKVLKGKLLQTKGYAFKYMDGDQ